MTEAKLPPFDMDAQAAVIATAILSKEKYDEVAAILSAEHFWGRQHQLLWKAISETYATGSGCDLVTVNRWIVTHGHRSEVPVDFIGAIIDKSPSLHNVGDHAKIIFDFWRLRELSKLCEKTAAEIRSNRIENVQQYIESVSGELVRCSHDPQINGSVWIGDGLHDTFNAIAKRVESGRKLGGEEAGFPVLDYALDGWKQKKVYVIAGRPGMGKTSLAMQLATNMASAGLYVAYFSLEMPNEELSERMVFCEARIPFSRLKENKMQQRDWDKLTEAARRLKTIPLLIDDTSGLSLAMLRAKVTQLQAKLARDGKKLFAIVIDYLLLMKGNEKLRDVRSQIRENTTGLKALAKDLNVAVLELTQLNRDSVKRGVKDTRPIISDLAESGSIEQDADVVMFVHRPDAYERDASQHTHEAEIILAKVRGGGTTGIVRMGWTGECTRFDNLEQRDDYDNLAEQYGGQTH